MSAQSGPSSDAARRLAAAFRDARARIGARQQDIADAAGISRRRVQDLERANANVESLRPATIYGLELAYRWEPGSLGAVLRGGNPTPVRAETGQERSTFEAERAQRWAELSDVIDQLPLPLRDELRTDVAALPGIARRSGYGAMLASMQEMLDRVEDALADQEVPPGRNTESRNTRM